MFVGAASETQELMQNINFMQSLPPADFHFSLLVDLLLGIILLIPRTVFFFMRRGSATDHSKWGKGFWQ
jgi:hypothetical protein